MCKGVKNRNKTYIFYDYFKDKTIIDPVNKSKYNF